MTDSKETETKAETNTVSQSFSFKDCALIAIATGKRAISLKELRDLIAEASEESLYYHFWGNLLLPRFEEREYNNDFASWAKHSLHDSILAEQLAVLDPTAFHSFEDLRQRLLEYIDDRLEASEYLQWSRAQQPFEFLRSQIVVFDTHLSVDNPVEMERHIMDLSAGSVFYHFIDARRRTEEKLDDFRYWLGLFGDTYQPLTQSLANIDPYFCTLPELRNGIANAFQQHFISFQQHFKETRP